MPKRAKSRNSERVERDCLDAIDRLKSGTPRLDEFKARIARGKVVPINTLNVAKEAGRSRSLIATDNPRYEPVETESSDA